MPINRNKNNKKNILICKIQSFVQNLICRLYYSILTRNKRSKGRIFAIIKVACIKYLRLLRLKIIREK